MNVAPLFIHLSRFPSFHKLTGVRHPHCEFHILAEVRDRYKFDESLFSANGNVIFPNFHAARVFAKKLNDARDLVHFPERTIKTGQLNAMGLIDEIYHYVLRLYETSINPGVFDRAHRMLSAKLSPSGVEGTIKSFVTLFPPTAIYKGRSSSEKYLKGKTEGASNLHITIEELMLLYFANFNPAAVHMNELFSDALLSQTTVYPKFITELENFFKTEKKIGPENQFLFDLLRAPMLAHPDSLEAQLGFIKEQWGMILSKTFLDRILGSMDLLEEENKITFGGHGDSTVPDYQTKGTSDHLSYGSFEAERFTEDIEWMPRVVLLAKNTYVWLDQLSRKYHRTISRLDQIPDEELDQLARWNFTGLWLIGLWERSTASKKIKQWTGNPEAVPSAYSLYEYEIARDLGGEEAFQNLNSRAWHRGIRLAGDMVPNHMGVYSKWILEHPEYFIQSDYCPFPNYTFTGGDLSENPGIQIRIDDGYWSKRDAAVVFQRIDNGSGKATYIYHGNDGTNMPWNDTAQLDLLRADVREAVIQTIFHVARRFSIIRFDAAMTLTKKHFQRLWYPQPGTGGDIPSRADHALSKERFDELFPVEFWREVVDRINQYMPGTLLLAEAFWLMEGYFVRTLGMHRVYNSAFMHMLMKEENENYRQLIKNTLEFNPEILKRYVNFMNNPDEQTAIAQFGKDDKYFGVALMMVTLPGLPMFGHGQIEGFTEKYGMEYKRAYYDEAPDEHLVRRHEHEIFPVMRKRYLFSQVTNFELYDFHDAKGSVNHNVFAYSNRTNSEKALIFYHNKYEEAKGWIRWASAKSLSADGGRKNSRKTLGDALEITSAPKHYYLFKDYRSNLEFIRSGKELHEHGMYVELHAFQSHVFMDFREVYDERGEYEQVARLLKGMGVPNIERMLIEIHQTPMHEAARAIFSSKNLTAFKGCLLTTPASKSLVSPAPGIVRDSQKLFEEVKKYLHTEVDCGVMADDLARDLKSLQETWKLLRPLPVRKGKKGTGDWKNQLKKTSVFKEVEKPRSLIMMLSWLIADTLSHVEVNAAPDARKIEVFNTINLEKPIESILSDVHRNHEQVHRDVALVKILLKHSSFLSAMNSNNRSSRMEYLLNDYDVREFIKLNLFNEVWYYNKECLEELLQWLLVVSFINDGRVHRQPDETAAGAIEQQYLLVKDIQRLSDKSNYQIEKLRMFLSGEHTSAGQ